MTWRLTTLITPAAHVDLARELCAKLPPGDSGASMFLTPLSATGAGAPTHYISSGLIQQEFADLMQVPTMVYAAAQQAGVATTQAAVNALLTACDISSEQPFEALGRLGLQIVQPA